MYWIFAIIIFLFLISMFGAVCVIHAKRANDFKAGWMIFLERDCYRAVGMYWRLSEVRAGRMNYERFLKEYNSVYGYYYDRQRGESPFDHQKSLHKTSLFRELANSHRDLVEKYMMGPKFRYDVEYKNLMIELNLSMPVDETPVAKDRQGIHEQATIAMPDPIVQNVTVNNTAYSTQNNIYTEIHKTCNVTNLSQQEAKTKYPDVSGSTKGKYTTFRDLLTKAAPENTVSRMSKYFSVKRKGIEVGLSQYHLEDKGYIRPVDRKTYVELAKAEFGITLSYTSIAAGVKGINRDDYTDEAREIIQTFEEYLTRDDIE